MKGLSLRKEEEEMWRGDGGGGCKGRKDYVELERDIWLNE